MAALLEVKNITKTFPGVRALDDVDLSVEQGQVVAVIGENGAGKSTMMKILAGVQSQDEGEILIDGESVQIRSVEEGLEHGIALIHQELNLATNLSVGANIYLGREPRTLGFIDEKAVAENAGQYLERVGL